MKTASIDDLRQSFAEISAWLEAGETVEVTRGGKPFAEIVPKKDPPPARRMPEPRPDIMARLKADFGNFVMSDESYEEVMKRSREERV